MAYSRTYKAIQVKVTKTGDEAYTLVKKTDDAIYHAIVAPCYTRTVGRKWFGIKKVVSFDRQTFDGCTLRLEYGAHRVWVKNAKTGAETFAALIREEQYAAQRAAKPKPGLFRRLIAAILA